MTLVANSISLHPLVRVSHFSWWANKHVVLRPPWATGVSWELLSNQDPAPQGGRPCSLHPPSARSYSNSAPSSSPPPSPPSSPSPRAGASPSDIATSPS